MESCDSRGGVRKKEEIDAPETEFVGQNLSAKSRWFNSHSATHSEDRGSQFHSPIPEHSREEAGKTLQLPTLIPEVSKGNDAGWDSPATAV